MVNSRIVVLVLFTIFGFQSQSTGSILEIDDSAVPSPPELFLAGPDVDNCADDLEENEVKESEDYEHFPKDSSYLVKRSPIDSLTRRSALDKNFMRFGRSGFFPDQSRPKPENRNLIRFTRSDKNNNFIRFGRGQNSNFMRFGRAPNNNFMRFGRGPNNNFMRFGRGGSQNFMRFGKNDRNFVRFGRGDELEMLNDDLNYTRFPKPDRNFLRFGKADKNFMRFGKSPSKSGSAFIRFGKSSKPDNFIRFGRSKNFMRFGRDSTTGEEDSNSRVERSADYDDPINYSDLEDDYRSEYLRYMRQPKTNPSNFMRFGREVEQMEDIEQAGVKSVENGTNAKGSERRKREVDENGKIDDDKSEDDRVNALFSGKGSLLNYYPQLAPNIHYAPLASGYPNFVVGPEFSILPQNPENKRGKGGSNNFMRFG